MGKTALFVSEESSGTVRCLLCHRHCAIPSGHFGACGVRGNKNGLSLIPFYGHITALAADPVEKKPLYHFRPGTKILSVGFVGCNLRCPFCQNWHISQSANAPGRQMLPADIVSAALSEHIEAIAYTYSEPLVHAEFLLDCMALARQHGIANVLVTNGCANAAAAEEILSLADAANIDLKCFSAETYSQVLGGNIETVLAFIRLACEKGVHVELTTLVVPGLNDSSEELDLCADFIASLKGGNVPWHLSAYHPDYRWNAPPTDAAFLKRMKERAQKKLAFVYAGNIPGEENGTACPRCGDILVRRMGYKTKTSGLASPAPGEKFFRCAGCGERTSVML
ncbi:MAG: AmmeMemoRadiSam system radical SAM enzyme [Treponema sp.]|jgi:pyruvate formate lyase activating enzyme|nr:AmmeMemoRadiSam system radical SAM enzyme [Treponema sp.]